MTDKKQSNTERNTSRTTNDRQTHFEVSNQRGRSSSRVRYIETNRSQGCRLSQ